MKLNYIWPMVWLVLMYKFIKTCVRCGRKVDLVGDMDDVGDELSKACEEMWTTTRFPIVFCPMVFDRRSPIHKSPIAFPTTCGESPLVSIPCKPRTPQSITISHAPPHKRKALPTHQFSKRTQKKLC